MKLGQVKTARGNLYTVRWDPHTREVYVSYAGGTYVGKASTPADAMRRAQAWLCSR